jgi:hypothetical protein
VLLALLRDDLLQVPSAGDGDSDLAKNPNVLALSVCRNLIGGCLHRSAGYSAIYLGIPLRRGRWNTTEFPLNSAV